LSYTLHPGAERDLDVALTFYKAQAAPSIARRFWGEFERAANLLVENPGSARRSRKVAGSFRYMCFLIRSSTEEPGKIS
jgi:plasmid stabilization system protein ParE